MGGLGSGKSYYKRRPSKGGKPITSQFHQLDISKSVKQHKKDPRACFAEPVEYSVEKDTLHLKRRDGRDLLTKSITISTMPCHFGGERYFGLCPFCKEQARILYLYKGYFACRRCLGISYQTKNETLSKRFARKWREAKKKINDDPWNKPKWMRKKTFERLRKEYFDLDEKEQIAEFFSLRNTKIADRILDKYGSALIAAETWEMERFGSGYFHQSLLPLYDDFLREAQRETLSRKC
jgi:hypothetical protein